MAQGVLTTVLQHLRRAIPGGEGNVLSDGQLLERFLRGREEAVFAILVERHAAMVWTVARRMLRDDHAAEDVFQATFFVLARKAESIARRPALAGWLYQVAYRLALRAKSENVQRQARERVVVPMSQSLPEARLQEDELRVLLDEELSMLPEKYRSPLVLHYLEGKSKHETAGQLGCTEGTVSGLLARARELLRARLVRRGFVLSASGMAVLLTERAAEATVAPSRVSATIPAALAFREAVTSAGAMSAPARLAESIVAAKLRLTALTIVAVLVTVVVGMLALWSVVGTGLTQTQAPQVGNAKSPAPGNAPQAEDIELGPLRLAASGKVVDEKGRPIAGATVYVREIALVFDRAAVQGGTYTDILAQTTTDAAGRFALKEVEARRPRLSSSNVYRFPWNVVITAKGRGLAWHAFRSHHEADVTFIMQPEARVSGKLVDGTGKPAAGVRVTPTVIDDQLDPDPRKVVISGDRLDFYWSSVPVHVVTDASGSFVFDGLPPGVRVGLWTDDPRFARKYLGCATIPGDEIARLNALAVGASARKLLPDGFTATLEPARTIRGQVTYRDTGQPAVGAEVRTGIFSTVTDARGRYSFEGVDSRKWDVGVYPPDGSDCFPGRAEVSLADTLSREQDFALERGLVITGRLRDKETGEPLRVPYVTIQYQGEPATPGRASASTRADGSFRIVVPPGKGKLFTWESVPGAAPADDDRGLEKASRPITISPGETLADQDLQFLRGLVVSGRALDPAGQPVSGAQFLGGTEQSPSAADGSFTLRGLSLEYKSHFLVVSESRSLGAKLTIEPVKDRRAPPVEVRLQPTRSASARVVDEKGRPVGNARVSLSARILMAETARSFSYRVRHVRGPISTDESGSFSLTGLVLEGSYTVQASAAGNAAVEAHFRVEADKETKVPDLVVLRNELAIAGIVVDPAGNPVEGVQVKAQARNSTLARIQDFMNTGKDGRFRFHGLPHGEYRLMADLWKPTGAFEKDGRPAHKNEASTELQVDAGQEDLRVILHLPQDTKRAASLAGKPAPEFAVLRWLNRNGAGKEGFKLAAHAGRVVLLAFLDEARPSQRFLQQANVLHEKYADRGLTIVRIYESPASEDALRRSPTPAAVVQPGLAPGAFSEAAERYGVRATPTLFLIDRNGVVRFADLEVDALGQRVEELVTTK